MVESTPKGNAHILSKLLSNGFTCFPQDMYLFQKLTTRLRQHHHHRAVTYETGAPVKSKLSDGGIHPQLHRSSELWRLIRNWQWRRTSSGWTGNWSRSTSEARYFSSREGGATRTSLFPMKTRLIYLFTRLTSHRQTRKFEDSLETVDYRKRRSKSGLDPQSRRNILLSDVGYLPKSLPVGQKLFCECRLFGSVAPSLSRIQTKYFSKYWLKVAHSEKQLYLYDVVRNMASAYI